MKNIGFFMNQILVNQFAFLSENIIPRDLQVDLNIQFKTDNANKFIATLFKVQYRSGSTPLVLLEVQCAFSVKPEDWDSCIQDDKLVLPCDFLRHIAVLTVGTTRGVLFCKTEGTPFCSLMLPLINVESMITQDLVVPIK